MEQLSPNEFQKHIDNSIYLQACPICGHSADIIISIPIYGMNGMKIKCTHCGLCTDSERIHETIFGNGKFGTPTTVNSIGKAIERSIQKWKYICDNKGSTADENKNVIEAKKKHLQNIEQIEIQCRILQKELEENNSVELRESLSRKKALYEKTLLNAQEAIKRLPDIRQQTVLMLKYIGEIKNGSRVRHKKLWQIGNVMGYSVSTIKKLHSLAIRNIEGKILYTGTTRQKAMVIPKDNQ